MKLELEQHKEYRVKINCNHLPGKLSSSKDVYGFTIGDRYQVDSVTEKGSVLFVNMYKLVEDDLIETEIKTITLEMFKNCFEEIDIIKDIILKRHNIKMV